MPLFDRVSKQIATTGQAMSQQAKNLASISRLNGQISSFEKTLAELFQSLGQAYYARYKQDPESEYKDIFNEIGQVTDSIIDAQEKIKEIKGIEKCPQCGEDVPKEAAFCSSCGFKMIAKPSTGKQYCIYCGNVIEAGSTFCTNCGRKVSSPDAKEDVKFEPSTDQED